MWHVDQETLATSKTKVVNTSFGGLLKFQAESGRKTRIKNFRIWF